MNESKNGGRPPTRAAQASLDDPFHIGHQAASNQNQEVKEKGVCLVLQAIQHPHWLSSIVQWWRKMGATAVRVLIFKISTSRVPRMSSHSQVLTHWLIQRLAITCSPSWTVSTDTTRSRWPRKMHQRRPFETPIGNFFYTVLPLGLKMLAQLISQPWRHL